MLDLLPNGLRGLMVATLFAAFMSTVDTQLNWGASYLTHDVYQRFLRPDASERSLVRVARVSVVLLAALGAVATMLMPSISGAWKFLASLLAGTGLIMLLRWLWWRINAWSEITVMAVSLVGTNVLLLTSDLRFPFSLAVVVACSVPAALAVTFLTAPETPETLAAFYRRVQPSGWWGPVAAACGEQPRRLGVRPWLDVLAATLGVYGLLLGAGALLLGRPATGAVALAAGSAALAFAVAGATSASRSRSAPPRTPGRRPA
jgi:hypothetical protein